MKILKICLPILLVLFVSCSNEDDSITAPQTKKEKVQQLLNSSLAAFPGLSLTVMSDSDTYSLAAGEAKIGDTPMAPNSLHYMQSIAKTYTAAAILLLKEQGLIDINAPMSTYLPSGIYENITNGDEITVRQLLNMTSGIADYLDNPQFFADVQAGNLPMTSDQVLSYVYNRPQMFLPGEGAGYSNINYHLLSLIIDNVTGQHHYHYIKNNILSSNGLTSSYYIPGSGLMSVPAGTTSSYLPDGDNYQDISELQFALTLSLPGDDGLIASTHDVASFYRKLLQEKTIIAEASLQDMITPVMVSGEPFYGMGLTYYTTPGGNDGIGHSGSGAGGASEAWYFAGKNTTIVLSANVGTLLDPVKEQKFRLLLDKLCGIIID